MAFEDDLKVSLKLLDKDIKDELLSLREELGF